MVRSSKWLILELSETVENINYQEIESALCSIFGDEVDYFIPIHHERIGSYISTSVLMLSSCGKNLITIMVAKKTPNLIKAIFQLKQ